MTQRLYSFVGGSQGNWRVRSQTVLVGEALDAVQRVSVATGAVPAPRDGWSLVGITSHDRYVERAEKQALVQRQEGLGRPEASFAALIPIRKSAHWWLLTQDERRDIFEAQSQHMRIGMKYLPPIARRLHHCRDLGEPQPFDFVTWFEYAPEHESAFDAMLIELRASPEWRFVERETDVRLARDGV